MPCFALTTFIYGLEGKISDNSGPRIDAARREQALSEIIRTCFKALFNAPDHWLKYLKVTEMPAGKLPVQHPHIQSIFHGHE